MMHRNMLWAGHLFVLILLGDGVRWLVGNIRGLPEFSLLLVLAAMSLLVVNHLRWWSMGKTVDEKTSLKIDGLVMANYCILVLIVALVNFRGR